MCLTVVKKSSIKKNRNVGNSLMVHWLGLHTFIAKVSGSIPAHKLYDEAKINF